MPVRPLCEFDTGEPNGERRLVLISSATRRRSAESDVCERLLLRSGLDLRDEGLRDLRDDGLLVLPILFLQ